jgi:thiol-disulfide isomerase/thioredoxin
MASARLPDEGELPSLDGATGWLNSPPLTPAGLRGKVILTGFWTYTCINWLRQLPYLRAWAGKYSGHGLVVIGVHTPEFSFEHGAGNVRRAVQDMRIDYPVATSTSSWGRQRHKSPGDAASSSTGSHPARRTEATSTAMATARSPSSGCTSSSASPAPSPTALSRSPSPTPAFRPTASLSDRSGGPAIPSTPFGPVKQINVGVRRDRRRRREVRGHGAADRAAGT